MLDLQRIVIFTTLFLSTLVTAAPHHQDDSLVDWGRLSEILDTIDNDILHSVLHHLAPKFRDGVFSKDRAAIEHVHSSNPVMATKLVYLAKRANETTTAASTSTSTTQASTSADPTSSAVVAATSTSVSAAVSSALSSQITQSSLPAPTTVVVAPTTPPGATAIATVPGGVVYSTVGGGVTTETSSAISVSFTRSTSVHLFITTGSNGQPTTSTSLVIVNAPVTGIATGAAAQATTSGPGLQSGASQHSIISIFGASLAGLLGLIIAL